MHRLQPFAVVTVLTALAALGACPAPLPAPAAPIVEPPPLLPPPVSVVINELACDGLDFVEVMNVGDEPVDFAGLRVTDDLDDTGQLLGPGTLAAGALYFVELGDGTGIRCGEETLFLLDGNGRKLDQASPPVLDDVSWGRLPDGTGDFVPNTITPGEPNRAPLPPGEGVFEPFAAPVVIELTVDVDAQLALEAVTNEYVSAQFSGLGDAPITVGLRIKGKLGSFRGCPFSCGDKSGLKLDFNRFVDGQAWRSLEKLNLNNQVQDPSRVHEWLAYEIFRRQGVPSPRVGFAQVRVNGDDWGLYALIEDRDDPFLAAHFPSTLALYEGEYGQDLFPGSAFDLDVDEGDELDRTALEELISALDAAPADDVYVALDDRLDWDEVLACAATEIFVGHWDGYAPTRNNYFLHVDDDGQWSLMPWGTDQTFDYGWPLYEANGLLLQRCLDDVDCIGAYNDALIAVATDTASWDYRAEVASLAAHLQPFHDADPRGEHQGDLAALADAAAAFLDARIVEIDDVIACQDATLDVDGDGATCILDCAEGDPSTFVGGDDSCPGGAGDGLDNDCNGRVDDGDACPDCTNELIGDVAYRFCRNPRTWDEANANCAPGTLAVVDSAAVANDVYDGAVRNIGVVDYWIGLTDAVDEGSYVWADGSALDFDLFAEGEPNDFGSGEDCTHSRTDGLWNDLGCDAGLASVCRMPAVPPPSP